MSKQAKILYVVKDGTDYIAEPKLDLLDAQDGEKVAIYELKSVKTMCRELK